MTIEGWVSFVMIAITIIGIGAAFGLFDKYEGTNKRIMNLVICVVLIICTYCGFKWYFTNTASGRRAVTDQKSDFNNGIERTITIYTADGKVIAQYSGKIDIEDNDGGYVLFDFDGKRYIYYNCFVESVADIN